MKCDESSLRSEFWEKFIVKGEVLNGGRARGWVAGEGGGV